MIMEVPPELSIGQNGGDEAVLQLSRSLSTGEYWLGTTPTRSVPVYKIGAPQAPWGIAVDKVEKPFAPRYDDEEYKNPALLMLNLAELAIVRQMFGIVPNWAKTDEQPMRQQRVLDVGCGTGRIALYAAAKGAWVAALDQTAEYVEATALKASRLPASIGNPKLFVSPVETILGSKQKFNFITAMFAVVNHCEDWPTVLKGLGGMLDDDGKMILSMYGSPEAAVFSELAKGLPYAPAILVRRTEGGLLLGEDAQEVLPAKFPYPKEVVASLEEGGLAVTRTIPLLAVTALYPSEPTAENIQAYIATVKRLYGRAIGDSLNKYAAKPVELLVASLRADYEIPAARINEAAYFGIVACKIRGSR